MTGTEHRVDVDGTTLVLTEAGPPDGPPVLLLHGFPDDRRMWEPQVEALAAAGHRVLAPDLRGYGDSDRPAGVDAYRLPLLVADVVGLLRARGVSRAAVVGHDWGAVLAWAVVAARPDVVDRLVVVSVGHPAARASAGLAQQVKGAYILAFLVPGLAERLLPLGGWWWLRRAWGGRDPRPGARARAPGARPVPAGRPDRGAVLVPRQHPAAPAEPARPPAGRAAGGRPGRGSATAAPARHLPRHGRVVHGRPGPHGGADDRDRRASSPGRGGTSGSRAPGTGSPTTPPTGCRRCCWTSSPPRADPAD